MNVLNSNGIQKRLALSAGITAAAFLAVSPAADAASFNLDFDSGANGGSVLYNSNGTLKTDQWASWGLTNITANNNATTGAGKLNLYNTDVFRNDSIDRDWDLTTGTFTRNGNTINTGTQKQGNVLILQEESNSGSLSNGFYTADDEAWGGKINFEFDSEISFTSFSMLDIDDNGSGIRVKGNGTGGGLDIDIDKLINDHKAANGNSQGSTFTDKGVTVTQVGTKRGNNSMYRFDLDETHFANIRLQNIEFTYPGSGAISGLEWNTNDAPPQEIPEPSAIGGLLMVGYVGARKYLQCKQTAANA